MPQLVLLLLVLIVAAYALRAIPRARTIFEYERGLLYVNGAFRELLGPGRYRIWHASRAINAVDVRPRLVTVPGQEVLTADGIAVKVTMLAHFRVADPVLAVNGQQSYEAALYSELQLGIRRLITGLTIDAVLESRATFGERLTLDARAAAERLGLELIAADVKDLTLPGELKKLFTQVTKARQDGLAALERARGETAALRNLANAARLVEDSPALMQLRLLQMVGEQSGNTIVLGGAAPMVPLPPRDRPSTRA